MHAACTRSARASWLQRQEDAEPWVSRRRPPIWPASSRFGPGEGSRVKILLPNSPLGPDTFADYEAAHGAPPKDLIVYRGCAISSSEYASRRSTPPTAALAFMAGARGPFSALVLSYPPALPGRPEAAAEAFLGLFLRDVLPALPVRPERIAVLGFSLGAALAVLLARAEPSLGVRLATVGAVGAAEAMLHQAPFLGPLSCPVHVARNNDDPCSAHSERLVRELAVRLGQTPEEVLNLALHCGLVMVPEKTPPENPS